MKLQYKKWVLLWFTLLLLFPLVGIFNYFVDPYGLINDKNKFVGTLTDTNNPSILSLKINLKADEYLVGSSRLERIDPRLIEHYLPHKKVYNVNISGVTFKENFIIAQKVKKNKKNFIFGFDAFTLNARRYDSGAIVSRFRSYKHALEHDATISEYLTQNFLSASLKDIKKRFLGRNKNAYFIRANQATGSYTTNAMEKNLDLANHGTKKHFTNYTLVEDKYIIQLAKSATKDDIFIIYPKYFKNYLLFHKYQNIEQKYFHGIELLVKNTKARVWSFYGINSITTDVQNFDYLGWHFKPNVSKLIFAKVFNDSSVAVPKNFGVLLTHKNVTSVLHQTSESLSF